MKFSFGFLMTVLYTTPPLATSFLNSGGGSCPDSEFTKCGETPKGTAQYRLFKEETFCDDLEACIGDEDCTDAFFKNIYCTENVNKAKDQGYSCLTEEVISNCFGGGRAFRHYGFPLLSTQDMVSFMSSRITTGECTTLPCGMTPDGKEQGWLIDPSNCDDYFDCEDDCFQYVFCADSLEIDKTILLTNYECYGSEEGPFAEGAICSNE